MPLLLSKKILEILITFLYQDKCRKECMSNIPLGRYYKPKDATEGILYLLSDDSNMVTGYNHIIDGSGLTIR